MIVDAVIEIPMGTKNKYEIDQKTGKIRLDRVLYSSVMYPAEYGYIDETLADDGDPLDILVLSSSPTFPGCIIRARVLGYLSIVDKGFHDEKIISVANDDPRFDHLKSIEELPIHTKEEIKEFFMTYKRLQNIKVEIGDWYSKDAALILIEKCKNKFLSNKSN